MVTLRAVEPRDIDSMYSLENDIDMWSVSGTSQPFSRYLLERFVESQGVDIAVSRQLRLIIEASDGEFVGVVDLFDYDYFHHRAGVGIAIIEPFRGRGYGLDALRALEDYGRETLQLHQLWCGVGADNMASRRLFAKAGYQEVGTKRDWIWSHDGFRDEVMLQRLL